MAQLTVADDEVELARLAAERVTPLIVEAVDRRGRALVALAGGTTPRRLYSNLADPLQPWRDRIPWQQVHLFWSDERHVPPDHPDSNYGMAKTALLDHVPIPADQVHRMHGEIPDAGAREYETELGRVASAFRRKGHVFDLMLLGLGEDAHVASIFPGSELLTAGRPTGELTAGHPLKGRPTGEGRPFTGRRVAAVWARHLNVWRVTLTPEAILDSDRILLIVAGANKAEAVHAAIEKPLNVTLYPAQLLRAAGDRVEWLLDRSASYRL